MRRAPAYLFRDTMQFQKFVQDGPRGRVYAPVQDIRCHWEGGKTLISQEGVRTRLQMARVWVPKWETEDREYTHRYDDYVASRRVGARIGAPAHPYPAAGLTAPVGISRLDHHQETVTRHGFHFELEDRCIFQTVVYQIVELREYDAPAGPDHIVLTVMNQREP